MKNTATEPEVNLDVAKQLGILPEEFRRICEIMGRTPNFTELSMYSVMWSEHCSYKNSILWLKKLPRYGERMLAEPGEENAGLIDIGDGLACAFKIESHNHPSAIEPYQGAATGVGGIHRDIFTMGARPIAALNSLRFGIIASEKTRHLLKGVVKGIGDYGNSFGVPTVAGETYFEECYEHNPLVNAMSVGIVEKGKTVSAISEGAGNPVFIVGSATGKDGIHGATFASEDITDESSKKLPAVQVGDPFQEKLLLEASLEAIKTGAIVGMQDMGAAGITCSTSEMSEKGGHGMKIYLDKVPTRQENMAPFEILLSESQERMLIVVKKGREAEVQAVFDKWDLNCVQIGEVTEGGILEYYFHEEKVAELEAAPMVLGGGAPVYEREYQQPTYYEIARKFKIEQVSEEENLQEAARKIISHPNVASKHWIYSQYDSMVGVKNSSTNRPSDAAIVRIPGTKKALAVTVDCNARYVYLDPKQGASIAVAECARNIICSGGEPAAITNCLNFGNPYIPENYWQFKEAILGMSAACEKFGTPVTGGNVSFYNQNPQGGAVYPTPVIGMVGILDDREETQMSLEFKEEGDTIYLIGASRNDINGSTYLMKVRDVKLSPTPHFDLEEEFVFQQAVSDMIKKHMIRSAHDISDGGLFVTLAESAFPKQLGFTITTDPNLRKDAFLFGEGQSRAVVSVSTAKEAEFESFMKNSGVSFSRLGKVNGGQIQINNESWGEVSTWRERYDTALETAMK